ncbi:hypothetical protein Rwratislav_12353 [Rhodococcus wratislaviensis IFP 2016]|nr:hypothetical protein Rwratislav_12353 [Rhodococcus wratislaviensis IFP 2016]
MAVVIALAPAWFRAVTGEDGWVSDTCRFVIGNDTTSHGCATSDERYDADEPPPVRRGDGVPGGVPRLLPAQ